jgi:hypothetical protein
MADEIIRILSMDGGGIIPARILQHIEQARPGRTRPFEFRGKPEWAATITAPERISPNFSAWAREERAISRMPAPA